MANNKGDKCLPWGTPNREGKESEKKPLTFNYYDLFVRYELNQDNNWSDILKIT